MLTKFPPIICTCELELNIGGVEERREEGERQQERRTRKLACACGAARALLAQR
jgi:hypothetical protein